MLDYVGNFLTRRDQLEDAPVDLPVAELSRAERVVTEVDDVQAVVQVVKHDTAFPPEHADRPGLIQRLHLHAVYLLAPVTGGWLEPEFLWRRAGSEEHNVELARTYACLVGRSLVTGKDPISHRQLPSAGRSHTCPS
ncbi:MAG TPA: hypothetical protein VFQ44_19820 [Streptosporangiaceae bacterium]|nr:hypothetical protein [Streptosporangiaceae bacterium]